MRVTGPISGGTYGWPFAATMADLDALGYVEEEWFLEGDATHYRLAAGTGYTFDGRWQAEPAGTTAYRTRMLIRRPRDPRRASGTVVVGWNNVSVGYENVGGEAAEVYESGSVFVGVSAQRVGVHGFPYGEPLGLTAWDPKRYGSLSLPDDDLSYDIFTQAARAVGPDRTTADGDPLGGIEVGTLLALGLSQSAMRLATYHNAVQPLTGCFDGFILDVYRGGGTALCAAGAPPAGDGIPEPFAGVLRLLPASSHIIRTDLDVPVMVMNSETEALTSFPVRQPDTDSYRFWEVAGSAHASSDNKEVSLARANRDFGTAPATFLGAPEHPNLLALDPVRNAVLRHMRMWAGGGSIPPVQPRIEIAGDPPAIVRDEHGNAVGGIRLPDLMVPAATHIGEGTSPLDLVGSTVPFPPDKLRALYPTHEAYVTAYERAVKHGVEAGFLLPFDAERLVRRAAAAPIP